MKKISFIAAALLCFVTMASAAIRPAQPGIGGGGSTVSGSITGAYSFNGPFSTVNATNVYLNAGISNLAVHGVTPYATNYNSLLRAYTNVITVTWSNNALASGLNLTNITTKIATAGTLVRVLKGPGPYWIGTNAVSLLPPGVDLYLDGAVITMGTTADNGTPRYIFDDFLDGFGARTNRVFGTGDFYITNTLGGLTWQTFGASEMIVQYNIARTLGNAVLHGIDAGSYTIHQLDYGRSDEYDFLTTVYPRKIAVYGGKIFAGDSIFEFANAFTNMGDCVIQVQYGEVTTNGVGSGTAGITLSDNVVIDGGIWNLYRNGTVSTGYTNGNATGAKAIIQNAVIRSAPDNTKSTIQRADADRATALTIRNSLIEGPTGVDPIDINPMAGFFTLENTRVLSGATATNSIRATTASSRLRLIGANSLDKPIHANVTVVDSTNTLTSIKAKGGTSLDGALNVGGAAAFTNTADFYADMLVHSPGTFQTDAGVSTLFGGGLILSTLTASRPLILNASGDVTNAVGTPDGTKFLRDDGTLAVPTNFITTAHGSINVTNSVTAGSFIGSGTGAAQLQLFSTNGNAAVLGISSDTISVTNVLGVSRRGTNNLMFDMNFVGKFTITNKFDFAASITFSNCAEGQEYAGILSGGGTSRVITFRADTNCLFADLDAFGVARATTKAVTLTNGNDMEISAYVTRPLYSAFGTTNVINIITRQYAQ